MNNVHPKKSITKFSDTDKIQYVITLTGEQIRKFLADVEMEDNPSFMWLERIMKEARKKQK